MKSSIKKELLIKIKYRAMTLLARREHSFLNLLDKLICIFPDESKQVYEIVLELKKKNLQSNLRFAEMITTVRIRKCYGQNRIKAELKSHKIDNDIIELSLTKCDADWVKIAKKAHLVLGCKGITRSDFKYYNNNFNLLEINTQPGMTNLSLVPEIASFKGLSFENLVEKILLDASINR